MGSRRAWAAWFSGSGKAMASSMQRAGSSEDHIHSQTLYASREVLCVACYLSTQSPFARKEGVQWGFSEL